LVEGTDRIGQRGAKMQPGARKTLIYCCIFKYLLKKRQHVMAITDRPPEMYERAITFRRPINDPGAANQEFRCRTISDTAQFTSLVPTPRRG
jgi:hypothetical protein